MSDDSSKYKGPDLHLEIDAIEGGTYRWSITMFLASHDATKMLGYKASGKQNGLGSEIGKLEISVRDENREVWTQMPDTHRPDIHKLFKAVLIDALFCLEKGKHTLNSK